MPPIDHPKPSIDQAGMSTMEPGVKLPKSKLDSKPTQEDASTLLAVSPRSLYTVLYIFILHIANKVLKESNGPQASKKEHPLRHQPLIWNLFDNVWHPWIWAVTVFPLHELLLIWGRHTSACWCNTHLYASCMQLSTQPSFTGGHSGQSWLKGELDGISIQAKYWHWVLERMLSVSS